MNDALGLTAPTHNDAHKRAQFWSGMAAAMADQWGNPRLLC